MSTEASQDQFDRGFSEHIAKYERRVAEVRAEIERLTRQLLAKHEELQNLLNFPAND